MLAVGQSIVPVIGLLALVFLGICILMLFRSGSSRPNSVVRTGSLALIIAGALFLIGSIVAGSQWQISLLYGLIPLLIGSVCLYRFRKAQKKC